MRRYLVEFTLDTQDDIKEVNKMLPTLEMWGWDIRDIKLEEQEGDRTWRDYADMEKPQTED